MFTNGSSSPYSSSGGCGIDPANWNIRNETLSCQGIFNLDCTVEFSSNGRAFQAKCSSGDFFPNDAGVTPPTNITIPSVSASYLLNATCISNNCTVLNAVYHQSSSSAGPGGDSQYELVCSHIVLVEDREVHPTPPPAPPAAIPTQWATHMTVYRQHSPSDTVLAERNGADVLGMILFLLVDISGGSTPSQEGDPATSLVSQFSVQYDKRDTGYSSCDKTYGAPLTYQCVCKHERQSPKSACSLNATGIVDLKPYYDMLGVDESFTEDDDEAPGSDHGPCNWKDSNKCQANLGKKLASSSSPFSWYSFPLHVQNSKWRLLSVLKTVHASCIIDHMAAGIARVCTVPPTPQPTGPGPSPPTPKPPPSPPPAPPPPPTPSQGRYSPYFVSCFFEKLLGPNWKNGTIDTSGATPVTALSDQFNQAFALCPQR
jgi:hypothetical protein